MNKNTLEKMQQMKLYGMHQLFKTVIDHPEDTGLSADELISQLVDAEFDDRYNRKINRLLKTAKFRYKAAMEEVDYNQQRNLDKTMLVRLAQCLYIDKAENILITGSTGVGKSYLACALGRQACYNEKKVMYFNTSRLLFKLKLAKAEGKYVREMRKLQRQHLLILDDFGLQSIDSQKSHILLEVVEDRYNIGSMIITSQIPVDRWYELIDEKTLADAIMDRIIHQGHNIDLKGESMRKKQSKKNN